MTDEALPPYTGTPAKKPAAKKPAAKKPAAKKPAAPEVPVVEAPAAAPVAAEPVGAGPVGYAPVVPGGAAPAPVDWSVVWHSRAVLISVAGLAALCAVLTFIGGLGFPGGPIEGIYWIGLMFDLISVAIVVGALTAVEYTRRRTPGRLGLPVNARLSVFAIIALVMSALAVAAWAVGGGLEQLVLRDRYMYATGGLFFAGIPWALGGIFGAWGFRPGGNRVTNILAIIALAGWAMLAAFTTFAALIYGAGLSD